MSGYVQELGTVRDIDDMTVTVGADYDSVSVRIGQVEMKFTASQADEFAGLFIAACWQAGANAERMRGEQR